MAQIGCKLLTFAVDELEQAVVLRICYARLVRNGAAHLPGGGVRSDGQCSRLQRPIVLVGDDDAEHGRAGGQRRRSELE